MSTPEGFLEATKEHVVYCFDALSAELGAGPVLLRHQAQGSPRFQNYVCPLFVTWNTLKRGESRLRGCIGTLEAKPLHAAVRDYALTSALRDRRFAPIERSELPHLSCTVSLLCCFERAADPWDWQPGTHGLLLEFLDPATRQRRTATFLPEVALHQRWGRQQTLEHLVHKAGYGGAAEEVFGAGAGAFTLTRYQSTTCTLSYQQYQRYKQEAEEAAAAEAAAAAAGKGGTAAGSPRLHHHHHHHQQQQQPFQLGASGGGGGAKAAARGQQLVTVPA